MATENEVVDAVAALLAEEESSGLQDTTTIARRVRMRWALDRDAALRAHPWNFAMELMNGAAAATPPAFGYSYRYRLASDPFVLRVWSVWGADDANQWTRIGRYIHTNLEAPLYYRAVVRVEDASLWDADFAAYFAARIAASIAYASTGSVTMGERIMAQAERDLRLARSIDGQEDGEDKVDRSGGILAGVHEEWG